VAKAPKSVAAMPKKKAVVKTAKKAPAVPKGKKKTSFNFDGSENEDIVSLLFGND